MEGEQQPHFAKKEQGGRQLPENLIWIIGTRSSSCSRYSNSSPLVQQVCIGFEETLGTSVS